MDIVFSNEQLSTTPQSAFAVLDDFPYAPHYLDWQGLRMAYIDEGARDAPIALLIHGEPTWSYLYRKMIPPLLAAGYRCIAPDHIGFGRSDKPVDDNFYTIARHSACLRHFIETLDLQNITLFCQDWGGPTGLRQAVDMPARFSCLTILNTWLHHADYDYSAAIKLWRDAATHPYWLAWREGDLPCGQIVMRSLSRRPQQAEKIIAAYEAPFAEKGRSKAGARRFPFCIPFAEPELGDAAEQQRCFDALKVMDVPKHFIFGEDDRIFSTDWGYKWSRLCANATFDSIPRAGHFCQEDAGEDIVDVFLNRRNEASK